MSASVVGDKVCIVRLSSRYIYIIFGMWSSAYMTCRASSRPAADSVSGRRPPLLNWPVGGRSDARAGPEWDHRLSLILNNTMLVSARFVWDSADVYAITPAFKKCSEFNKLLYAIDRFVLVCIGLWLWPNVLIFFIFYSAYTSIELALF